MNDCQLPIFTYGTLRPGHHNFGLLADVVVATMPATTEGLQLLDAGPYPYAVYGPGRVHGDLITVGIDDFATTLADLDRLEGFDRHSPAHSHYQRVTTQVTTATGDVVLAWVYVAGPTTDTSDCVPIPGGDWAARPATPGQDPTPMCGIFGTIRPHTTTRRPSGGLPAWPSPTSATSPRTAVPTPQASPPSVAVPTPAHRLKF